MADVSDWVLPKTKGIYCDFIWFFCYWNSAGGIPGRHNEPDERFDPPRVADGRPGRVAVNCEPQRKKTETNIDNEKDVASISIFDYTWYQPFCPWL